VAATNVENLDERVRGGIRSVSMFAGIAMGIPSGDLMETGVRGGVTLRLILNFRFPTDKNPPSGDCNTKRLLFGWDHMPETVKTLCQSSRSFVKRRLADSRVYRAQLRVVKFGFAQFGFAQFGFAQFGFAQFGFAQGHVVPNVERRRIFRGLP
jgi:hypothetical protein